jgi:hypothetical protein
VHPSLAGGAIDAGDLAAPKFSIAEVHHRIAVRASPAGRIVARVGPVTGLGSPQRLGVVESRRKWLAVVSSDIPTTREGWVKASAVSIARTSLSVHIDLSRRTLVLKNGGRRVQQMTVGIGAPATPTPVGRFAVTDKLSGRSFGPWYGCCIVALSARQEHLRSGWTGGDRIAIHGTDEPGSIGTAESNGCLHAASRGLHLLMRQLPLGTPVFIRD